ncbi:hypothetical protein P5E71_14995 [Clostridium perfringens]|nr:hypothetical protein [Clostridium perfringens]MDK0850258.1 hypothetical protein [Clostridium perfringens]
MEEVLCKLEEVLCKKNPKTRVVEPFNFCYININININRGVCFFKKQLPLFSDKKEKIVEFLEDFLKVPIIY